MASLWSFFGLPDPDAPQKSTKPAESANRWRAIARQSIRNIAIKINHRNTSCGARTIDRFTENGEQSQPIPPPNNWAGPLTADGEPFHDLGVQTQVSRSFPTRALRYVAPDEMKRIPTRGIAQRIANGDTVIVDLRGLVHMDSHQNACRRDLKMMTDEVGVGVFALDQEDKLLMIPGTDVVVDISNHSLGINPLM